MIWLFGHVSQLFTPLQFSLRLRTTQRMARKKKVGTARIWLVFSRAPGEHDWVAPTKCDVKDAEQPPALLAQLPAPMVVTHMRYKTPREDWWSHTLGEASEN